jgi:uncharacterized protein (DUF2252 family)
MKLPDLATRHDLLLALRNQKMASSPHAYVRGNTARFYEWLHSAHGHRLPNGPAIWICGDCHSGNLGPLADPQRRTEVQIRDFDQTTIGNPAHDLVRLGLSLATAARGSRLPGIVTARMLEAMLEGYEHAFHSADDSVSPKVPSVINATLRSTAKRSWKHLARERLGDTAPILPLGKHFWPLTASEKANIKALIEVPDVRTLVTALKSRDDHAKIELLDAAYWVKGCSSLGLLRYAVLLRVDDDEHCLIDIKEAVQAAAPRYPRASMPRDNAKRVVEGARRLSPSLGKRMSAQRFADHGVFIRELLPQDLKLTIDELSVEEATLTARYLANVVGTAHARQMDSATRASWLQELTLDRNKRLDAPAWVWKSVVQLLASHESGYLEHCRRYALPAP